MHHGPLIPIVARCAIATACIAALTVPPLPALAQPAIYEGWSYPAGDAATIAPGSGVGWQPGSGYAGPLAVTSPSLTHPAALPSTGNALATTAATPNIGTSRGFGSALDSSQTLWMSFLLRRDSASSTAILSLQQLSGNRTFSATFGVDVDPSDGVLRYKARWENIGFAVTGGDAFASRPFSAVGDVDLFLVRINPADTVANTQTFDMWVDPSPSALGTADASITWPSGSRVWSQVSYAMNSAAIDELRVDPSLGNVINLPAPQTVGSLAVVLLWAPRRRREPGVGGARPECRASSAGRRDVRRHCAA